MPRLQWHATRTSEEARLAATAAELERVREDVEAARADLHARALAGEAREQGVLERLAQVTARPRGRRAHRSLACETLSTIAD
jgi:hypothetical protein